MKRLIVLLVIIIVLAGAWYGYRKYTAEVPSLTDLKTDVRINALDLISAFEKDSASANKQYLGKILEVTGNIKSIEQDEAIVVLGDNSGTSSVRCSIDSNFVKDIPTLNVGANLSIKGHCTGFNPDETGMGLGSDVILNRCVLPEKK